MEVEKRCHNVFCSNLVTTKGKYCKGCAIRKSMEHVKNYVCIEEDCNTRVKKEGCRCYACNLDAKRYLPSPEQIEKECLMIRNEWDEHTRETRIAHKQGSVDYGRVYRKA